MARLRTPGLEPVRSFAVQLLCGAIPALHLASVDFSGCSLAVADELNGTSTLEAVLHMIRATPTLRNVNVSETALTDEHAEQLASAIVAHGKVETVCAYGNEFGDDGAAALFQAFAGMVRGQLGAAVSVRWAS